MACRTCGRSQPRTPFVQGGTFPTIFAWGPFANVVPLTPEQGLAAAEAAESEEG